MEAVLANPKASIESLMALVLERHGVTLNKQLRLVYRARNLVRSGKAVVKRNILPSQDAPLPEMQFVRRHARDKKPSPEPKKLKNQDRMAWTDVLVESLLIERVVKHGKQFVEAGEQSQHRELWEIIRSEFNAMHEATVTVTQLRAKFRYLQEQYLKVRGDEEAAARDASKLVIYPRRWDMLVEYFGVEARQGIPNVGADHEEGIAAGENGSQAVSVTMGQLDNRVLAQSVSQTVPAYVQTPQLQPTSVLDYPAHVQAVHETQALVVRQAPSSALSEVAPKRRRVNPSEAQIDLRPVLNVAPPDSASDLAQTLETIQSVQDDMARSMDSMKHVVEQSNQVIRGLEQALTQSNQVNTALLDFLRRQPPA
ncbi:hypothetical protein PHYPSEUDO_015331 [Phytophthora pseudosyringae]|uniref:Myb/SANT-like domain-containing protein n=1 Tax=Phytophthora pseudosyringae TaxID=221518 RepID=A0A8T1VZT3_9STRA|nr:hypothetical protein PHYPSEUDO_015331 [Phytophthora pseudosyringae]